MKTSEMIKKVKKIGCFLKRHGGDHDIWYSPRTGKQFTLPGHPGREIPKGTAEKIMKDAGLY